MEGMEVIEAFLRKQALVVKWAEGILGYELNAGDLWEQLKSGVDLCRLMLKLKEGSIPVLHENPKIQFVKKENIVFFIEAAKEFGVPRWALFDVPDLFEERDLQRVLDCLEEIALKATANGIEPKYQVEADKAVKLPKLPPMATDVSKADKRATRLMNRGRPLPMPPSSAVSQRPLPNPNSQVTSDSHHSASVGAQTSGVPKLGLGPKVAGKQASASVGTGTPSPAASSTISPRVRPINGIASAQQQQQQQQQQQHSPHQHAHAAGPGPHATYAGGTTTTNLSLASSSSSAPGGSSTPTSPAHSTLPSPRSPHNVSSSQQQPSTTATTSTSTPATGGLRQSGASISASPPSSSAATPTSASTTSSFSVASGHDRRPSTESPDSAVLQRTTSMSGSAPRIPLPASPREKESLEQSILRLVSAARGRIARRLHQKRVTDVAYRARVAQEILATETSYVSSLQALVNIFCRPLMANSSSSKPLLPEVEVKSIFSSLEVIVAYNEKLLQDLRPRVEAWSPTQRLGDIFLTICGFLKVYTNYIANYNASIATLNRCRTKKEKFAQWLAEQEEKPEVQGLKLGALLILPVQRIPRYQLLLSDLAKHTWPGHADYADLLKATQSMADVAMYLNDKKREADNIAKVTEIQEQFTTSEDLALPHRRFVKEFTLKAIGGKDKEWKDRKFYFFNDLIVITKPHRTTTLGVQMPFLSKTSDKNKEKVISSHFIVAVNIAASPNHVPGSSGFLFDITGDKSTQLYSVDAGSAALRDECISLFQNNASEQRGKQVIPPTDDPKSPALARSTKEVPTSRPTSSKSDREEGEGEKDASGKESIGKDAKDAPGKEKEKDASGKEKKKDAKGRPSRGKEWLQNIRSTLHGDPRKGNSSLNALESSTDSNSSDQGASSGGGGGGGTPGVAPRLQFKLDANSQMPASALSPRTSISDENSSQEEPDRHHDHLAGALSPRRPPSPPAAVGGGSSGGQANAGEEDDYITARRASFKRSMTERVVGSPTMAPAKNPDDRPALPPKPDRLRSGVHLAKSLPKGKPKGPPPSMGPPPMAPSAPPALNSAPLNTSQGSPSSGSVGSNDSAPAAIPSLEIASPSSPSSSTTTIDGQTPLHQPAPMRKSGSLAGENGSLRRQNAFKSKTFSATTTDLLKPGAADTTAGSSSDSGVSPSPSPRHSGSTSNGAGLEGSTSSADLTEGGGDSPSSPTARPTRVAPSPRASVAASGAK